MKKIIILAILMSFTALIEAQLPVWAFYHQQRRGNGVMKFAIPGFAMKIGARFVEDDDTKRILKKVGSFRLVVREGEGNEFDNTDTKRLVRRLQNCNYENLIAVKDGKDKVNIMVKTKRGTIRRYFLLVNSADGDAVMISGKCKLSIEDFSAFIDDVKPKIEKQKTKKT